MQERGKFKPLIESAIQKKQRFSLKYNKLVIEGVTYFYDASSGTVELLTQLPLVNTKWPLSIEMLAR